MKNESKRVFESSSDLIIEETSWVTLDPLTMTRTSARLYSQFNRLLCDGSGYHKEDCLCDTLERHYGKNPFKCSFLGCFYGRYGFSKKATRDSHLRSHKRPWKCGRSDCQYSEGFLSRRMRDQHWERHHQENLSINWSQQNLDEDELQPLLFDAVKGDKVEMAIELLPQLPRIKDHEAIRKELLLLAAGCASMAMVHLVQPNIESWHSLSLDNWDSTRQKLTYPMAHVLTAAIEGNNIEVFKHLLHTCQGRSRYSSILPAILRSSNEEFRIDMETCVDAESEFWTREQSRTKSPSKVPFSRRYTRQNILKAITGDPGNVVFLLSIWKYLDLPKALEKLHLGDALVDIAATCCSATLAKYLIDGGAEVDRRRHITYLTPLHHAATRDTQEAAELIQFLLNSGADPSNYASYEFRGETTKIRHMKDEKGAQRISKWLQVSWEDLVTKIQAERLIIHAEKAETGVTSNATG